MYEHLVRVAMSSVLPGALCEAPRIRTQGESLLIISRCPCLLHDCTYWRARGVLDLPRTSRNTTMRAAQVALDLPLHCVRRMSRHTS